MEKRTILLTFKNLGYVHQIISKIEQEYDLSLAEHPFRITTATIRESVHDSLESYVTSVNDQMTRKGIPITLQISTDLKTGLQLVDGARDSHTPENLIRLLGIVSHYPFVGPTTIHLDLTNACNTNCIYCWWHSPYCDHRKSDSYTKWASQSLDKETAIQFLKEAKSMEVVDILIAGAGEPLLHPDIDEIIATSKQLELHTHLFTNGHLLTPKKAKLMIDNGIDMVSLTLSATTLPTFLQNYPQGSEGIFNQIIDNIRFFTSYRKKTNADSFLMLCFVINNTNYKECADYIKFAQTLGVRKVRFQMMDFVDGTRQFILSEDQLIELKKNLSLARNLAKHIGVTIDENIDFQEQTITTEGTWSATTNEDYCFAGWYFTRLWTDKNISFCCSAKSINSLDAHSYQEIWKSKRYRHARMAAVQYDSRSSFRCREGQKLIGPECRQCGNYEFNERALRMLNETGLIKYLPLPKRRPKHTNTNGSDKNSSD